MKKHQSRKTYLLTSLIPALFLLVAAPEGAGQPTPPPAPRVVFVNTVSDAGVVWEGEKAAGVFKFKNSGDRPLQVKNVRTSCGCTAALADRRQIEPGQEGMINAEFNTRHYRGKQKKYIYVSTNDPLQPTVRLIIEAEVKTVAAFSPRALQFRQVTSGEKATQTIRLISEDASFKITKIESTSEQFQVRIVAGETEPVRAKEPVEIEVTLSPEAASGRHCGNLIVYTDHPRAPKLEAKLVAAVEGPVQYSPRLLIFNRTEQENRQVKTIHLAQKAGSDLTIRSAEITIPQLQLELKKGKLPGEYDILVQPAADSPPDDFRGQVIIRTNQKGQEEIKIPVQTNIKK